MRENRVVITGLGVISPVGNDIPAFWKSLKEGKSGVGPITSFDAASFDSRIAGEVKDFDPKSYGIDFKDIKRTDKFVQYAIASARQAIDSSIYNQRSRRFSSSCAYLECKRFDFTFNSFLTLSLNP